jgi:hypothetical protein
MKDNTSSAVQTENRRLAAIMFTDIVGFSRQMGSNEARTLRLLEIHNQLIQQAVAEYHGTVIKTVGDAFLADFPSVVHAVQGAQQIQTQFRIHNAEMFRVLKSGGRVVIHDTEWDATLWYSSDPERMARIMKSWEGHLADPHLPQTLSRRLADAGFKNVRAEAVVQLETSYDPSSVSAIIMKFVVGYVVSQGVSQREADAWADELRALGSSGDYFFSSNEYLFTAEKP